MLHGNAYQAASPALTAFGAESRPRSSPPTTRNYLCGQQAVRVCLCIGNAYQAARPALTSYGAESRPSSSPPTTRNYLCGQQAVRVSLSAHPPMRKATAFLTLANARHWRAYSYLYGNACVLYGNAYQAASPALTSYGAESRPRSSPPTTLKLPLLYGNAFLQQISTAARFFHAQATLAHKACTYLLRSFLRSFLLRKKDLRTPLRRYVQQPLISAANSSSVTLVSSTVTLTKLQARLSQPLAQRADLAAAHPPP